MECIYIFYESYIKQIAHISISFCLKQRYEREQKDLTQMKVIEELELQI